MCAIIGGLMDGKSKVEFASDMNVDGFMVARMIKTLQAQLRIAA